jgi:hypothetical protein
LHLAPDESAALPDGLPISLYEDSDNDGRVSVGDHEWTWPESRRSLVDQQLRTNGERHFAQAGFFFVPSLPVAPTARRIYVRIWNDETRSGSSGSWVSPLTTLRAGNQQISFAREEWRFEPNTMPAALHAPPGDAPEHPDLLPYETQLTGCYPNPFNASATIRFTLSADADVALRVFDIQGRQVSELTLARYAAGEHHVPFVGSALSSGTYLITLYTDRKVHSSLRVILLK